MNAKKYLTLFMCAVAFPTSAFAHGHVWYDVKAHVPQFKKLVIYPIGETDGTYMLNENEKSLAYKLNDYLDKRFVRKLHFRTISLGRTLKENKEIRTDEEKYKSLYNNFATETERGKAVFDITAADGYLVPRTRECRIETYTSPQTTVTVSMRSWTEVKDSPKGDYKTNERSWTESHVIPEKQMQLYHMDIEHTIYDRNGQKVLTYENSQHSYDYRSDNYREKMFKDLVDEFRKDVKDIQDYFKEEQEEPRMGPKIGFKGVSLPVNVREDECVRNAVYFNMKDGVRRWTETGRPVFESGSSVLEQYYVDGSISQYSLDRIWIPPHASTWNKVVNYKESKWKDARGKEHKMKVTDYVTDITDHYGVYSYTATVSGTFNLKNSRSGQTVLSHSATERDDKTADAYLHLMKAFYGKVSKKIDP